MVSILITGGNRGIGLAIVKSLCQSFQSSRTKGQIFLGSRKLEDGAAVASELQRQGFEGVKPVQVDVTSEESIAAAVKTVQGATGRTLDVLINNAGYAVKVGEEDPVKYRQAFQDIYNVNVTSVAAMTNAFLPLLRASARGGKVINISSKRASLQLNAANSLPPTAVMAYSVSKTAVNMLTVDMARQAENESVEFQLASPGHCKTAFNGYRGTRDPEEGAIVIVELVLGARRTTAMYETVGSSRELEVVPW